MENVLVVGGAGYVGGPVVDLLSENKYNVTVYDVLAYEEKYLKSVPFIYGDIRDKEKLKKILPKYDVTIWLAAIVGDGACAADPFLTQDINETSVKWLVDNYGGLIVYPSTCSVYGINENLIDETALPNPISVYAKTKLAAEQYILQKAADRSLIFRLGTLFGLGDAFSRIRLDLVVNVLAMKAARGQKITVFGGNQWRPLLHVKDVAEAILMGLKANGLGLFNLSSKNVRIFEIAKAIQEIIPDCEIEKIDIKFEDQRNYKVLTEKWEDAIRIIPSKEYRTLEQGIQEIICIIKNNRIKNPDNPLYSNNDYIKEQYRRWL